MNENELRIINETQNEYENLLIDKIYNDKSFLKTINFSSPTGTGKTKMMADIIDKINCDYFFVITTLSRGQLNKQLKVEIERFTKKKNYLIYGLNDYTKNTILQEDDILSKLPNNKKIIWFRDEGHISTNRWMEIFEEKCYKIINFSATNKYNSDDDIKCNFNHTMMLRTVIQADGEPIDAIKKLLEVKEQHKKVKGYNPCAIFRILDDNILKITIEECEKRKLKYINITDEHYDMAEICKDDNEYDVIINKFKVTEGIDIRRAHVLYMTNEPKNPATTIQVIGRCRRNALLYRNDIDIFSPQNKQLLENTRKCYVFYNVHGMNIDEDENGNFVMAFCPIISVQQLRKGIEIELKSGVLNNGLTVLEADGESGKFKVDEDKETGFNILNPMTSFYEKNRNKNYKYICYKSTINRLKTEFYRIYRIDDYMIENKYFDYDDYIYDEYTLSKEKSNELYNYLLNNKYNLYGKVKVRKYVGNRKRKYNYYVESYQLTGPKTYFDELIDFNSLSISEIVEIIYKYVPDSYPKRFITRKEALEYADKIKNITESYVLPNDLRLNEPFRILVNKRFKFKSICSFNCKNELNDFMLLNRKYTFVTEKKIVYLPNIMTTEINDKEIALLAGDMKVIKKHGSSKWNETEYHWVEDTNVTSKISKYSKLNMFISNKYGHILKKVDPYYYTFNNQIFNTRKFNSMFGFCVEYTTKLLFEIHNLKSVFRRKFDLFLMKCNIPSDKWISDKKSLAFIVRTAIEEYQINMKNVYGLSATKIPSISYDKLIDETEFLDKVLKYAKQTYKFLLDKFNDFINDEIYKTEYFKSMKKCDLSVSHISGLADFIINDTIIDIKCTSSINEKYIKQVLAYHWLSKKHELNIKKVMIYETIKDRYIIINLDDESIETNIDFKI